MHGKDPFSDFREIINAMESRVQELGKVHGVEHLAGPQGFAVRYLFENQDKEIFIKDIEKRLSISKSVASNLVKRMEKNGFVELVTSDKDKRYKYVHLTDLGKKKAQDVGHFREAIHEQLLEGISKEDAETAFRVFHQIHKNLEKIRSNLCLKFLNV